MNIPLSILVFNEFQPMILVYLVIIVVLLILSGMMSGSETALFSLSPGDIESIKRRGGKADKSILKLLSMQDMLLATVLIGNNFVNIFMVLIANMTIDMLVTFNVVAWEFVIKTIVVTFILLLFGEIIPKIYSSYNPLKFARTVAPLLLPLKSILKPFAYILTHSSGKMEKRVSQKKMNLSMDELSNALEITENQSDEEKQMLEGIVSFVGTDVSEIMKLRMDIVALDETVDFAEVKRVIIESGFSRIPVYEETVDNIKGILYVKDMVPFIGEGNDFKWQTHLRQPYFVPENKKINDLLEDFQTSKVHLAIVVDEYGSTLGLLSLEDILEEIVGEITDESDVEAPTFYKKIDDRNYMFEGKTHLYDLEKVLNLDEDYFSDVCGGAETIAGLMLELKRDFLKKGERVSSKGISFTVDALAGRRIDKVKVTIDKLPDAQAK